MIPIGASFIAPSVPEKSSDLDHYPYDDAYWLRYFSAALCNSFTWSEHAEPKCEIICVQTAKKLLAEIKRVEAEK